MPDRSMLLGTALTVAIAILFVMLGQSLGTGSLLGLPAFPTLGQMIVYGGLVVGIVAFVVLISQLAAWAGKTLRV